MKKYGAVDLKGLTGATQATRWVGATASGPPTSGTFALGDHVYAQDGAVWACWSAGSPGLWVAVGRCLSTTLAGLPAAAAANAGTLAFITDTGLQSLVRSDGSTWSTLTPILPTAKGSILVGSGVNAPNQVAVGTAGQLLMPDSGAVTGLAWFANPYTGSVMPTGAITETVPRYIKVINSALLTTAQLYMVAIWLPIRTVITSITFMSGTTALSVGANGWAALFDASRNLLRQSTDAVPTWAANTAKTFTLSSTYTTTAAGNFYVGLMIKATTVPTLLASDTNSLTNALAVIAAGTSTGSLTGTAPNPAAAITAAGGTPYAYVS